MAKADLILTEEQAIAFGQALQTPLKAIAKTAELSRLHGDTVASLYRVAALKEFRKVVSAEEIKALIIAAAGDGYEVAESATFKIPDEAKLEGAVRAMQKGYLLSDERGPHFCVILGKGGVSVLTKEAGHRHKFRRAGCKQVDVVAAATKMRPRPNAAGKFDMIVEGKASCVLDGELIEVHRGSDFPIILPCYDTDGPDGHEAKARRRLLRDLWAKVSGDFEPIELSEVDTEADERSVVIESPARIEPEKQDPLPPKFEHPLLDKWRPLFKGAPKIVMTLGAEITKGLETESPEILSDCEPLIAQIESEKWKSMLTGFLKAVLDDVAAVKS